MTATDDAVPEAPAVAPEDAHGTIRMEGITKRYGALVANDGIDFDVASGEVHALLGENGAGKSTLMGIMFGLLTPDAGRIVHGGREVRFASPADALRRGIGMVHQHFMLVPTLTVAENVVIGSRPSHDMRFRRRELEAAVGEVAERHNLHVDPRAYVRDLSVEDQQRVEIVRLLYRGANTLILDEPTAALGSAQVKVLLATLKQLQASGRSIVIVTHKLDEVMAIADRATVLKGGRNAASLERSAFEQRAFTQAMFDAMPDPVPHERHIALDAAPRIAIEGLTVASSTGRPALRGLDLELRPGEIVGLAGVAGNGQTELLDAIAGVAHVESGTIAVDGADIVSQRPLERRERGIRVIPEDRHDAGLVLEMTVAENLALTMVPAGEASRHGLLRRREIRAHAEQLLERFDVRPGDPDRRVHELSGGNQQKVVVARELSGAPRVVIASCPTRGLDISAAASIHRQIESAAADGCAVLVISPDLDEVLALADRVAVIFEGRIVHDVPREQASSEAIGLAMVGQAPGAAATAAADRSATHPTTSNG
ncbi:MAG TPA: ABC transporter ATP-binding protein [Conexibacter sp.]|nr:ABC transporter ATP-binding protein [Conexibacter sp.]